MMLSKSAEEFLQRFDHALAALHETQRTDIVREVRSHFEERGEALDIARAFGTPEQYAASFVSEQRLSAALARPWPWRIVGALLATVRDTALFVVVLCAVTFELTGFTMMVLGALKPFYPESIGTFFDPQNHLQAIGSVAPSAGSHEVLGYWAVPIFITFGACLFLLGHRGLVGIVRWRLRLLRSHRLLVKAASDANTLQLG